MIRIGRLVIDVHLTRPTDFAADRRYEHGHEHTFDQVTGSGFGVGFMSACRCGAPGRHLGY